MRPTIALPHFGHWGDLPPGGKTEFAALFFLFAASGVNWLATRAPVASIAAACAISFAYTMHLPLSMPLDKMVQEKVEDKVRSNTGRILNTLMSADDAVVLEPLGFIGWEVRPKTTYDFPGLSSPKSFAAFSKHHHMTGLIIELAPEYVVQRPRERREFEDREPDLAAQYEAVQTVKAEPGLKFRRAGLQYYVLDKEFTIYRRTE